MIVSTIRLLLGWRLAGLPEGAELLADLLVVLLEQDDGVLGHGTPS